ncbi:(3S,6E)-nerolidol synthase 1-like [Senna tora]|uniref:(3S,6E)-nerolidol synthase 1-like n=1 Tax=Senna tora TaxID=362788 RepID=A0A835CI14_9FABA|nr:(3S,6E)-nerolidol synthase 1-like [Senna tora]
MSLAHPFTQKPPFFVKQISGACTTKHKAKHIPQAASQQRLSFINDDIHIVHAKEVKNVRKVLVVKGRENAAEGLCMIDMIQRLGIEHHFEEEIESAIQNLMLQTHTFGAIDDQLQLRHVSLQFRLLRQQGCHVHADVFEQFKDKKGRLKQKFWGNIEGLIEVFEASHLSIEGENDVDQAGELSHRLLSSWLSSALIHDQHEAKVVANTLKYPIHTSLSRFTPRSFLFPNSQLNMTWLRPLQKLSKLDTQIVNSVHLKEIYAVSKWWKDLGLAKDLKFGRDEPIKWYMWSMACLTDPCFSEERIEITKPLSLVYIIDDIFDVYASMDELSLFVDAVSRWDLAASEQLPHYMKACFRALQDITNEFANKFQNKHGWNPRETLIKSWVRLCNAFMEEAKWLGSGKYPKAEEYLKNGIVSTGVHVALLHAFFLMGQGITKQNVDLMNDNDLPTIISSTATILRLCDDLEGDKDDGNINQASKDGSYLKCYMKDHPQVSIEQAKEHIRHKISDAWKCLNKECLTQSNPFPFSFTKLCLSAARMVPLMYSYDGYSPSRLEEHVKSLLCGDAIIQTQSIPEPIMSCDKYHIA